MSDETDDELITFPLRLLMREPACPDRPRDIYFVRAVTLDLVKIGVTDDAVKRMRALATTSPDALALLGIMAGSVAKERLLHERFAANRSHGEWFRPDDDILFYIRKNCQAHGRLFSQCEDALKVGPLPRKRPRPTREQALRMGTRNAF